MVLAGWSKLFFSVKMEAELIVFSFHKVALLNTDGTIIGSGSLLDGRYVVTAAHKVAG